MFILPYNNFLGTFEFDHVGIATSSIENSLEFYKTLGFSESHREVVKTEGVQVAMIQLANHSKIELLEPLDPLSGSPVAQFLLKKGPGIHHICLRTNALGKAIESLKQQGFSLINEIPRQGAHNMSVVFIHPKSTGGLLIELSEPSVIL